MPSANQPPAPQASSRRLHERSRPVLSCLGLALALCLGHLTGCGKEATVLLVTVSAKEGISSPRALEVSFSHEGEKIPSTLSHPTAGAIPLPTTFAIRADGRVGAVEVSIRATDQNKRLLGQGSATATLLPEIQTDMTVWLHPADFQINASTSHDQIFSIKASGRQLAAAANGNFVVLWEDNYASMKTFDIWYRLFDRKGSPRINSVTKKNTENRANESPSEYYDYPAMAMQRGGSQDGAFLAVWMRGSSVTEIRARSFDGGGRPDPVVAGGAEQRLNDASATRASVPDVEALTGGSGYVVTWQQEDTTNNRWQVMARLLDSRGLPLSAPVFAKTAFEVASFSKSGYSEPLPVVAGGKTGGFLVAWRQDGLLLGSFFGGQNQGFPTLQKAASLDGTQTTKAEDLNISPLANGYGVIWTDQITSAPDTNGTCIRFRRFDLGGKEHEREYTLNTSAAGNQQHPALAMRDDGSLLAAWTTTYSSTDDPGGGIRGRKLLSNGLPVGNDFAINTTTSGRQEKPSVAPHLSDGFIVVFVDASAAGPDTQGSGIRGRLLYPNLQASDGQIGTLCDASHRCGASLACKEINVGNRCLASCMGLGGYCAHGGRCTKLSGGYYCTY